MSSSIHSAMMEQEEDEREERLAQSSSRSSLLSSASRSSKKKMKQQNDDYDNYEEANFDVHAQNVAASSSEVVIVVNDNVGEQPSTAQKELSEMEENFGAEIIVLDEPPSPSLPSVHPSLLSRRSKAKEISPLPQSLHVYSNTTATTNSGNQFSSQQPTAGDYSYGHHHYRVNSNTFPNIPSVSSIGSIASLDDDSSMIDEEMQEVSPMPNIHSHQGGSSNNGGGGGHHGNAGHVFAANELTADYDQPSPTSPMSHDHVMIRVQSEDGISESTMEAKYHMEHLKDIMMLELHGDKIPLSNFREKKIILPSESLKAKEMAIESKVKLRDKRIERWKKAMERAKAGLSSSLSMESLVGQSENSLIQKLKDRCLNGPLFSFRKKDDKKKIYDVRREDLDDVKGIIMDLGYALSMYGVPSHRLEYYCALIASFYGIMCTTFSVPTGLFFCFGNYDEKDAGTYIIKITSSSLNLSKLCQLDDVAERIARGQCTIAYARRKIKEIIESRPLYNNVMLTIFSCFLQSGMFSVFFSANMGEVLASFVAGLVVGILSVVSNYYESIGQVVGILCGVVSGVVGIAFKVILGSYYPVSVFIIALNGVISLLPGLTFTVSITELSARQLLSGSSRLMSAFVAVIQLGFGVLIADKMAHFVKSIDIFITMPDQLIREAPKPWLLAIVIPILALSTVIQFKAPKYPLALFFIIADAYAGFFSTYFCTMMFGKEMGAIVGAFSVGVVANIYGLVCGHPSIVVSTCGIIYLVPGSLGYRSVDAFLQNDSTRGMAFIFDMFITGISLTVGLLLADLFALKRKKLSL